MKKRPFLTVSEISLFAMFGGVIFASKLLMASIPNVHLVGLFILVLTAVYRVKALVPIYVYILLEGVVYGFSAWWVPYLYVWLPLWGAGMALNKIRNEKLLVFLYPVAGLLHGLTFGTMFAPSQALFFHLDFKGMIGWIAVGFPYDLVHGASNLAFCFLAVPLIRLVRRLNVKFFS